PQRIAAPNYPGGAAMEPLRAGMMLSNEPGYYKAGEYGIRIENLILIEPRTIPGADRAMLGFETLTFCPIERTLIEPTLLNEAERQWVDDYHAQVLAVLTPEMTDAEDRAWLTAKCAPLS
ncbi:MAG: M24 family metallopeptidase, partial [Alphaproteobacteria bacterium]